jgi:DNA/RNA-binding domain of Phe-tRNA-synthetase-like protein
VRFSHSTEVWKDYPDLVPGVLAADRISADVEVEARVAKFVAATEARLEARSEAELPEIQAWRRAFSRMGLKPTQYRCASEALLRRLRKEGSLPQIHPLIDLCNAVSIAFAIPVAVFDLSAIAGELEVRYADGSELYESFSGGTENPEAGEVIFADGAGRAHARRWTNRQSTYSAVRDGTSQVLIVAEALHASARADMENLVTTLADELESVWSARPRTSLLTSSSPGFELDEIGLT